MDVLTEAAEDSRGTGVNFVLLMDFRWFKQRTPPPNKGMKCEGFRKEKESWEESLPQPRLFRDYSQNIF